jgi:hypothetical protein
VYVHCIVQLSNQLRQENYFPFFSNYNRSNIFSSKCGRLAKTGFFARGWPKDVGFKVQFGCLQEVGRSQAFEVGFKKLLACRVLDDYLRLGIANG